MSTVIATWCLVLGERVMGVSLFFMVAKKKSTPRVQRACDGRRQTVLTRPPASLWFACPHSLTVNVRWTTSTSSFPSLNTGQLL